MSELAPSLASTILVTIRSLWTGLAMIRRAAAIFRCFDGHKVSSVHSVGNKPNRGRLPGDTCIVGIAAGTIFDRTRISLKTWFAAIWFVTSQKDGASALGRQRC